MVSADNTVTAIDRISIQVALSGYSFKVSYRDGSAGFSGWQSADRIFTTPEFQRRYDEVDVSLFTPKVSLFPTHFFSARDARRLLSDVVPVSDGDAVETVPVPEFGAVMVYSNSIGESLSKVISDSVLRTDGYRSMVYPEQYFMLKTLPAIGEYNKIVASYADGRLYLAIAQGKTLLLCNSFEAQDFTTAEYFIFRSLKKLQLNPEMSSVFFRTPLTESQEMSLYRYFTSVEHI